MKDLYNSFENKPEWISLEEINDLENKMLNDDIQEKLNVIDSDPELGTVYSPDTFEEFKDIIENNKLKSYDDQISFYLLYDKEFPYGYEFTIQLKDDDFYKVIGHIINKDSINVDLNNADKYRDVDNFKGSQSVIDFIEDVIDTDGLDYYEASKGIEIIHNYLNKEKSNNTTESLNLLYQLKAINNQINEESEITKINSVTDELNKNIKEPKNINKNSYSYELHTKDYDYAYDIEFRIDREAESNDYNNPDKYEKETQSIIVNGTPTMMATFDSIPDGPYSPSQIKILNKENLYNLIISLGIKSGLFNSKIVKQN
jgi:hypothetical protein